MNVKIFGALMMAAAFGALSATGEQEIQPEEGPRIARIDAKSAYVDTRWIGLRSAARSDCPPVAGWDVESSLDRVLSRLEGLDRDEQPSPAADRALLDSLGLSRFCIYTATTHPPQAFDPPRGLVAARDRMAVSASADGLEARVWETFKDHFLGQSGRPRDLALSGQPGVRLTFVDSQPYGGFPPRLSAGSLHGYTLAHLSHQLLCPESGRCAVDIATRRALSHDRFEPGGPLEALPESMAGEIGTIDELAEALLAEVLHWQQTGTRHLVLNVSLGWDGELFPDPAGFHDLDARAVKQWEPSVQHVYQVLRFAQAKGVLVIAAAGNRRGGPSKSAWPLLPAAWELKRPSWCPLLHRRKLIYAVGGVDWQGLPLPNSRPGGHPRRAAYGDHAVADRGDHEPTGIYTGSSVAAAVVSSVAAAVWQLRPELRPDQVMRLIDRSGDPVPLSTRADFYSWRRIWPLSFLIPAPRLSEVSLCEAVRHACATSRSACPVQVPQFCSLARRPPALGNRFPPPPPGPVFVAETLPAPMTALCNAGTRFFRSDPRSRLTDFRAAPCPSDQFGGVTSQRWVLPQPDAVPCPGCVLGPPTLASAATTPAALPDSHTLQLQISANWATASVGGSDVTLQGNATLDIDCYAGGRLRSRTTYQISFDPDERGLQPVPDVGRHTVLRGCTAQLNFVVVKTDGTTMSIQNPVAVAPVAR
jgi:Subtilase family